MPAYATLTLTQVSPHFQQSQLNTGRPPWVHWTEDSREEQEMFTRWMAEKHNLSSFSLIACLRSDAALHLETIGALPRGRGLGTPTASSECLHLVQRICLMLVRKETSPEFVRLLLMELTWGRWSIRTGSIIRRCTMLAGMWLVKPTPWYDTCIVQYLYACLS